MTLFPRAALSAAVTALATIALFLPTRTQAEEQRAGDLIIQQPWLRATPPGLKVAAGYVTIVNIGGTADHLLGGSIDAATGFAVHDSEMKDGMMTMSPTGPLEIPAGGIVTLAPAGLHVMFTGLKRNLVEGQAEAGTLVFERAGTVTLQFSVRGFGAEAPAQGGGGAPSMPGMDMK